MGDARNAGRDERGAHRRGAVNHGAVIDTLAVTLRNIAAGNWNLGRRPEKMVSVHEYAREALRLAGLDKPERNA
jgi:hypothetical protein